MATGESGLRAVATELLRLEELPRTNGVQIINRAVEWDAAWERLRALLARPVDEPLQCPVCGCNYYYCLPSGQVTGCEHPWHFKPHPIVRSASSPTNRNMGEAWRPYADLIGDETRSLSERKDAARTILGALMELTDDPIVTATYSNTMKLIEYIDAARYDAELGRSQKEKV